MPYAVELYFNPQAETAVRHIWQTFAAAGRLSPMLESGYRPHVSLAVYDSEELNIVELQEALFAYAGELAPFPLQLSHIGIFPAAEGVLYLGVSVTQELLDFHARFHNAVASLVPVLRPYYQVGRWVPHCTLAYQLTAESCADLIPICWPTPLPLQVEVQEIGISHVSPSSHDLVFLYDLSDPIRPHSPGRERPGSAHKGR
jgi:2'-5' RNA ligase